MAPPHRSRELNTDSACVQKTGGGLIDKQSETEGEREGERERERERACFAATSDKIHLEGSETSRNTGGRRLPLPSQRDHPPLVTTCSPATQEREEPVWPQAASAEGNSSSNCGVILSHSEDPGEQGERGDTLLGEQLSATAWIPRGPPSDSQLW